MMEPLLVPGIVLADVSAEQRAFCQCFTPFGGWGDFASPGRNGQAGSAWDQGLCGGAQDRRAAKMDAAAKRERLPSRARSPSSSDRMRRKCMRTTRHACRASVNPGGRFFVLNRGAKIGFRADLLHGGIDFIFMPYCAEGRYS
jgi:hypothetical protein